MGARKKKCCKRFKRKPKACKKCPLMAQLGKEARKRMLKKSKR